MEIEIIIPRYSNSRIEKHYIFSVLCIFDMFYFHLSFMDKTLKCRLIGNMNQSKSNCLLPIPKPLKEWKDITEYIYGKEKAKLNAFQN